MRTDLPTIWLGVIAIDTIIYYFELYGEQLPLELFVFIGTFVEELFAPIPSLLVLVPAGAAAEVQNVGVWYLGVLALLSAAGRALGASVVYWLADKFEDLLLGKNRKIFGYSHADIEKFGARLRGSNRDWWVLFLLNVFPALPPVLPIVCGFLKVRFWVFVTATFCGNILSALTLLVAGYTGLQIAAAVSQMEVYSQIIFGVLLVVALLWLARYYKTHRRPPKV